MAIVIIFKITSVISPSVLKQGGQYTIPGAKRSFYSSRYFGSPDSGSICNRHFKKAKSLSGCFGLHLSSPAIPLLFHVQLQQNIKFNCPERTEVGIMDVVESIDQHNR